MAESPPLIIDPQDPLPESSFFYRRAFSFVFMATLLAVEFLIINHIAGNAQRGSETAIAGLVVLCKWHLAILALSLTYYMLAPSAEQLALIIQSAKVQRESVNAAASASAAASAGPSAGPAAPVLPAPAPAPSPAPAGEPAPVPVLE